MIHPRTLVLLFLALAYTHGTTENPSAPPSSTTHSASWSYSTQSTWSVDFPSCGGRQQSPINLVRAVYNSSLGPLDFMAGSCQNMTLEDNGHDWKVGMADECISETPSSLRWEGVNYVLQQFHMHSPSEHRIGSGQLEGEVHFVHKSAAGALLVVGVFLASTPKEGALSKEPNSAEYVSWDSLIEGLFNVSSSNRAVSFSLPAPVQVYNSLFPATPSYYHYEGSLTTPPCSEGVTWIVMEQPVHVGWSRLQDFQSSMVANGVWMGFTSRSPQPLYGRVVHYSSGQSTPPPPPPPPPALTLAGAVGTSVGISVGSTVVLLVVFAVILSHKWSRRSDDSKLMEL